MNSPDRFPSDSVPSDDWMDVRVEAYLDADLPAAERARFEHRLGQSAAWQQRVAQARRLQHALRALPAPACPARVTRQVLSQTVKAGTERNSQERPSWAEPVRAWAGRQARAFWQPALAMSLLVALVLSAALLGRSPAPSEGPSAEHITEREVEQATAEVKWTLSYLAHIGEKAGASAQKALLEIPIVRPLHQALEPVLDGRPQGGRFPHHPSSSQDHD